jgi:hypothetical protein
MIIKVHINRIVLNGILLEGFQKAEFHQAVTAELTSLLSASGTGPGLSRAGTVSRIQADPVQLTSGIVSGDLGRQVARAVYGGMGR